MSGDDGDTIGELTGREIWSSKVVGSKPSFSNNVHDGTQLGRNCGRST